MPSPACERAISLAFQHENALLKFITPNDVGVTGAHQYGYYLPKALWQAYTSMPPTRGLNNDEEVHVTWPDGRVTESRIKWYGQETRSEYRITRFGRDFPYRTPSDIGSLLVLVRTAPRTFEAFVLDLEDDIHEIQSALGVEVSTAGGAYSGVQPSEPLSAEDCLERQFRAFVADLTAFPSSEAFSSTARRVLRQCVPGLDGHGPDRGLMEMLDCEYRLFRMAERVLCAGDIVRSFTSVDDFVATAARIMNRRKSRAGYALESHVTYLLSQAGVPFTRHPSSVRGRPDIVIPSVEAYEDPTYPEDQLFVVGLKTTLKERWRQILHEAPRVTRKYLLTTQPGVPPQQLREMDEANLTLVVPRPLHHSYPPAWRSRLLPLDAFIAHCSGLGYQP